MTRKTSFYYSFLALPAQKRQAITAVFDFCRAVDDSVDLETDPERAMAAVARWRDEVARVFTGGSPGTVEGRQLQPFVSANHLPREQFDALVDGVAMDVVPGRYQTFADLEPYCHRVASSVGLMCAEIFEYREPAVLDYARDLGVALQLTNILRDVAVDYRVGRLYLPLEDLARHGCTEADIRREVERAGPGVESVAGARGACGPCGARTRVLRQGQGYPAEGRCLAVPRRRDHARDLLGDPAADRRGPVRCLLTCHQGPSPGAGAPGDQDLVASPVNADVVIVGAGVAGLAAATCLAEAGRTVVVVEESPRLGGRATAFTDRETGERVDNGQHVLFGCYRETYAWLDRMGVRALAPLQSTLSLSMAGMDGRQFGLRCPPLRPPLHLIAGVLRWPALPWRDRLSALRMAPVLRAIRREGAAAYAVRVPADQTVSEWLREHGQSRRLCEWLWDPLAIAALNQSAEVAAAGPFVRVLGELFGPRPEDSAIGLPRVPLDDLFGHPAVRYVEARGGRVLTRTSARVVVDEAGSVSHVRAGNESIASRHVICSVPWHALARVWDSGVPPSLAAIAGTAASMSSSPIVTVNLWYNGPVMSYPFVGLIGGPMHWVFDKSTLFGEQAGHLSIVASGADALARLDNAAVTREATTHLAQALPAVRERTLLRSVVVREQRATFSLAPGSPVRPGIETPVPGFFLAGDWTDTGLPGTIEGAVQSGHRAADAVLRAFR